MSASIQARIARWKEFYDLSGPRRLVFLIRHAPSLSPRPLPNPEFRDERLAWILDNYAYHVSRSEWLDDDTVPCLDMLTGTELFAEAFGCRVHRPRDANPFALPLVGSAREAEALRAPSLDAPPLAFVLSMADELRSRAGPDAPFRLPDLQSPLDVAALVWEKTDFYAALIESPGAVLALASEIRDLQFAFLDEWFRRYGRGFVAHYPDYWMSEGATLSVDEIGAVSSEMFLRFFLPDLRAFSARYGGLGIHCCAHARHQWKHFSDIPGLRLVNINNQGAVVEEAYPFFRGLCAQWHNDQSPSPRGPDERLRTAPPEAHIVLDVEAGSRDEARRSCDRYRALAESRTVPCGDFEGRMVPRP